LSKEIDLVVHKNVEDRESRDKYILRKLKEESALDKQVGGNHYKDCVIQPVEFIAKNEILFLEGNIIKYATRHAKKGEGRKDVEKIIHYAQLILELYYDNK
tara:strand:+ start:1782 stop:2084 length:303 start_codon:yes stop_codon:yes gene_type:complete